MSSDTLAETRTTERKSTSLPIIDTDVHESFRSHRDLIPYLDEPWRGLIERGAWSGMTGRPYAFWSAGGGLRVDAKPDSSESGHAVSSYDKMRQQHLDLFNIERVILTGYFYPAVRGDMQVEFSTALASAYNDFLIDVWLGKDERFRSSLHIAPQDPEGAAREIDRLGDHPQFVQVMLPMGKRGYGDPFFFPIFEAAERHGLRIATHQTPETQGACGIGRYYIERHAVLPQSTMAHLISLIVNGVFDRFPRLKFALVEGGWSWLPHVVWRLDHEYKSLRQEIPWVKRLPSEHIVKSGRVVLSTQPAEDLTADQWLKLIDLMGSDELLVFSSDYPHWDFDSPERSLPARLPEGIKRKVLYENARRFYDED